MTQIRLHRLAELRRAGTPRGITSICSAHPLVLRAALRFGRARGGTVLIEATCNQVNHRGGYTGMRPADFIALVGNIAREENCPQDLIVFGADHLGPNPWRHRPADEAMAEAEAMVNAFVAAGFTKIHLDASMGCQGEPVALDDEATAHRAARLARAAEAAARQYGKKPPVYVIGTEVPPPGGADHVLDSIEPTSPEAARQTLAVHRSVFFQSGLSDAFSRAIALVVQPGVEFGNHNAISYDGSRALALTHVLDHEPQFVFEAHSTDYQPAQALARLVRDGFAILKVGPQLTFELREALYGLDLIASTLLEGYGDRPVFMAMEDTMLAKPENWQRHYPGDARRQQVLRHFSLSDRIRYYWTAPEAAAAVQRLFDGLRGNIVPGPVMAQFLPSALGFAGKPLNAEDVAIAHVTRCISTYHAACQPDTRG